MKKKAKDEPAPIPTGAEAHPCPHCGVVSFYADCEVDPERPGFMTLYCKTCHGVLAHGQGEKENVE